MITAGRRHLSSLVGTIRLNESVSRPVANEFAKYPASCDRIEIFDDSIPNDPSPPWKAAAVLLRSRLSTSSNSVACVTVLRQKIFDYNNRDFQKMQIQNLVDSVSKNWLRDSGGGIQISLHRISQRSRSTIGIRRRETPLKSAQAIAKSLEFGIHRNWKVLHGISFYNSPMYSSGIIQLSPSSDPRESVHVEGLSRGISTYKFGEEYISVVHVEKFARRVHCVIPGLEGPPVTRERYIRPMQRILRDTKCLEAILFSERVDDGARIAESLIITQTSVDCDFPQALSDSSLRVHPEFII